MPRKPVDPNEPVLSPRESILSIAKEAVGEYARTQGPKLESLEGKLEDQNKRLEASNLAVERRLNTQDVVLGQIKVTVENIDGTTNKKGALQEIKEAIAKSEEKTDIRLNKTEQTVAELLALFRTEQASQSVFRHDMRAKMETDALLKNKEANTDKKWLNWIRIGIVTPLLALLGKFLADRFHLGGK